MCMMYRLLDREFFLVGSLAFSGYFIAFLVSWEGGYRFVYFIDLRIGVVERMDALGMVV